MAVGKKAKDSRAAATRIEIETELDVAEGLLSKTTGALALALVQEIGAIRAALYSPREVPDGLWPRTRNVAKGALAALASGEQDTDSRAQDAKGLDALITELLANDKDVKEFRELFRDSASTEKSIVDEWHARLSEIRRAGGSAGRLRGLYNNINKWTGVSAKSEIQKLKRSIRVNFESGVPVGEFLVVHFNKTSAYSSDERAEIRGICAEATKDTRQTSPGHNEARWSRFRYEPEARWTMFLIPSSTSSYTRCISETSTNEGTRVLINKQ